MRSSTVGRGEIESVSTRIILDDAAQECTECGGSIESGQRHKVATVREGATVVYHEFCTSECIDAWESSD